MQDTVTISLKRFEELREVEKHMKKMPTIKIMCSVQYMLHTYHYFKTETESDIKEIVCCLNDIQEEISSKIE